MAYKSIRRVTVSLAVAALLAASGAAYAQSTAGAPASAPGGSLQQSHGEWRSSKLVGSTVYNDQGTSIGTIDDLLVGSDGKITDAVVSVGGFLGIGSKLVSIPFGNLKFQPSSSSASTRTAPMNAPGTPAATPSTMTGPGPATSTASTTAYFGIVLPGATKDTLTSMGEFKY